jgi:hypothetical protein
MDSITTGLTRKARTSIGAISSGTDEDRAALQGLLDFTTARRQ